MAEPEPSTFQFDFPISARRSKIFIDELYDQMTLYTDDYDHGTADISVELSNIRIMGTLELVADEFIRSKMVRCPVTGENVAFVDYRKSIIELLTRASVTVRPPAELFVMILRGLKEESEHIRNISLELLSNERRRLTREIAKKLDILTEFIMKAKFSWNLDEGHRERSENFSRIMLSIGLNSNSKVDLNVDCFKLIFEIFRHGYYDATYYGLQAISSFAGWGESYANLIASVDGVFPALMNMLAREKSCRSRACVAIQSLCVYGPVCLVAVASTLGISVEKNTVEHIVHEFELRSAAALSLVAISSEANQKLVYEIASSKLVFSLQNLTSRCIWHLCLNACKKVFNEKEFDFILGDLASDQTGVPQSRSFAYSYLVEPWKWSTI